MTKKSVVVVRIGLKYGGRLWPEKDESRTYEWDGHTVNLGIGGVSISTGVNIAADQQVALVKALTSLPVNSVPHWQSVPAEVQTSVLLMGAQLRQVAAEFDRSLRSVPSAVRLPPYRFATSGPNPGQQWPVMWWSFDDESRERFKEVLKDLEEPARQKYCKGLQLPLPTAFEARHVNLDADDMEAIGRSLRAGGRDVSPSHTLWSIAWQNYEDQLFPAAVIVLASAIETALKWYLSEEGDEIARYLLEETQAPILPKLLSCARSHADLDVPKGYQSWLADLMKSRNALVHKPRDLDVDPLEIGRWFAVGEAILNRAAGHASEPLAGTLVQTSESIADFPAGTLGVVMRREIDYGEETLHILLDSGDTRRFSETAFEKAPNQSISANRS